MTTNPKPSFIRRWLLPLLAGACAAGLVWWLLLPGVPRLISQFETHMRIRYAAPDGSSVALADQSDHFVLRQLDSGLESPLPTIKHPYGDIIATDVTASLFWKWSWRRHRYAGPGPYYAYDRSTGRRLKVISLHYGADVHVGEKLTAAWEETRGLRLQVHDPRSDTVEADRLVQIGPDFKEVFGVFPSPKGDLVGVQLILKKPTPFSIYFGIVDLKSGKLLSLIEGLWPLSQPWDKSGQEVRGTKEPNIGNGVREDWAERFDARTGVCLGRLFVSRRQSHEFPRSRDPEAYLSRTGEWLISDVAPATRTPFSWLNELLNRWLPHGHQRLIAVSEKWGTERVLVPRINSNLMMDCACAVLNDESLLLARLPDGALNRYGLYALPDSDPWPWPWRVVVTIVAGLLVGTIARRLLRPRTTLVSFA